MSHTEKETPEYLLTFGSFVDGDEVYQWVSESEVASQVSHNPHGVWTLSSAPVNKDDVVAKVAVTHTKKGTHRSAVVLRDSATTVRLRQLAERAGRHEFERYIDGSAASDWAREALAWVKDGIEPSNNNMNSDLSGEMN